MSWLAIQLLWFGFAAAVIAVDASMMKRAMELAETEQYDLKDRRIGPFVMVAVIFGAFVIPFYLWYSRRSSAAVLAGLALMAGFGLLLALLVAS